MAPAALGTETQSLSSLAESIRGEEASGGEKKRGGWGVCGGAFLEPVKPFGVVPLPQACAELDGLSLSGHHRKLISLTFAG